MRSESDNSFWMPESPILRALLYLLIVAVPTWVAIDVLVTRRTPEQLERYVAQLEADSNVEQLVWSLETCQCAGSEMGYDKCEMCAAMITDALARIGTDEVKKELIGSIYRVRSGEIRRKNAKDWEEHQALGKACEALYALHDPDTIQHLLSCVETDQGTLHSDLEDLPAEEIVEPVFEHLQTRYFEERGKLGKLCPRYSLLVEMNDFSVSLHQGIEECASILAAHGQPARIFLEEKLLNGDVQEREVAAWALGQERISEASHALAQAAQNEMNEQNRIAIGYALSRIARSSEEASRVLHTALEQSETALITGGYVFYMYIEEPQAEHTLAAILEKHGDTTMADDFLNSHSPHLQEAAKTWAKEHGYDIVYADYD